MKTDEFQQRLFELRPAIFEDLVAAILRSSGRFREVSQNVNVDGVEIDIVAKEKEFGLLGQRTWLFEVKSAKLIGQDVIRAQVGRSETLRRHFHSPSAMVLVVAGAMTRAAQDAASTLGIEVWDGLRIASECPPAVVQQFFGDGSWEKPNQEPKEAQTTFGAALSAVPPGTEGYVSYQDLVSKIFTYLFCPPLENPRFEFYDDVKRNRRDMIFENSAPDGFWAQIRTTYSAHYIVVDAKNHEGEIGKDEAIRLAHYLKPYGCGMFGILVCRKGGSDACRHAIKEQWIGAQKMILIVTNDHLLEMLRFKDQGSRPEEMIRSLLADFRMKL